VWLEVEVLEAFRQVAVEEDIGDQRLTVGKLLRHAIFSTESIVLIAVQSGPQNPRCQQLTAPVPYLIPRGRTYRCEMVDSASYVGTTLLM
jgi:hypothetical protein